MITVPFDTLAKAHMLLNDAALIEALTTLEAIMGEESSVDRLLMLHECCASPHEIETLLATIKELATTLGNCLLDGRITTRNRPQNRPITGGRVKH